MATPTDAEKNAAADCVAAVSGDPDPFGDLSDAIAQALADQRADAVEQFRVETRQTVSYSDVEGGWWPEGDHYTFDTREAAERFMRVRAGWYDAPDRFEHRITRRTVTPWKV